MTDLWTFLKISGVAMAIVIVVGVMTVWWLFRSGAWGPRGPE